MSNRFLLTLARGSILDKREDKTALMAYKSHISAFQIAVTVIVVLVVMLSTAGGVAYVVIRKRRNAELAQVKYLQQHQQKV